MKNEVIEIRKEVDKLKTDLAEKSEMVTVPYVAYEAEITRLHNVITKLIMILAILIGGILIYSCIPDDYSSQDIENVDTITESEINNGGN